MNSIDGFEKLDSKDQDVIKIFFSDTLKITPSPKRKREKDDLDEPSSKRTKTELEVIIFSNNFIINYYYFYQKGSD